MIKRSSWQVQKSVIYALFLREANVRFSAGTMGYFWVIFEPLLQISIFVTVKIMLFGTDSNFDYAVFITLGFVGFNLFKHLMDQSIGSFSTNKGLYAYKQVKPIDTIVARVLVELLVTAIIVAIFIVVGFYFGFDMNVQNLGMVVFSFFWLILFSISLGLLVAVIGVFFDSFKKIVKLVISPLMFISAIFYSMQGMPKILHEILYFNPLAHFMEMMHAYYFYVLNDDFVDYYYLLGWTILSLYIGLWSYQKLEKKIVSI